MIKEIINDLIDDEKSLVRPLLKTKVLATRLKNKNLLNWVNKEISGYSPDEIIPNYRIGKGNSSCNIRYNNYHTEYDTPFPISYISNEKERRFFYEYQFRESVKTLEIYTKNNKEILGIEYPIDFCHSLTRQMKEQGFKGQLTYVRRFTHVSNITQSLTEIRAKFLDLMLILEAENPNIPDDFTVLDTQNRQQLSKTINLYMNNNYINNSGDGSTINTGSNNQINSSQGSNNKQEISFNKQSIEDLQSLINQIIKVTSELDISKEDKDDIKSETERMKAQMERENPKINIIGQSLQTIRDIMVSITANDLTAPVIQAVQNMLGSLGF